MEEMWDRGEASVRQVMEALNADADKERAYTTYMTIMARLDGKGLLERRREGKTDFIRPGIRAISTRTFALVPSSIRSSISSANWRSPTSPANGRSLTRNAGARFSA